MDNIAENDILTVGRFSYVNLVNGVTVSVGYQRGNFNNYHSKPLGGVKSWKYYFIMKLVLNKGLHSVGSVGCGFKSNSSRSYRALTTRPCTGVILTLHFWGWIS